MYLPHCWLPQRQETPLRFLVIHKMTTQLFNQRSGEKDNSFTIDLPVSEDPFKRPENDRVKALRFSAFTAPDQLSGLTPPYCPFSPTLWRREADEHDSDTVPVNRRSPLREVLPFQSLKSAEVRSCFRKTKFSFVTQSSKPDSNADHFDRLLTLCRTCSVCLNRAFRP
jgi:hypothetical protein